MCLSYPFNELKPNMNSVHFPRLMFALCIALTCFGTDASGQNRMASRDTLPFQLTPSNNLLLQAVINAKDTVTLMFHTAASGITLIADASDKMPSVSWNRSEEVTSWGGTSQAKVSTGNDLQIASLRWDSLTIWQNENSGPGSDGKFGPDLFEGKAVEISYDQRYLVIHQALPEIAKNFEKIAMTRDGDMFFVEGTCRINDNVYPNLFLIHSGYGGTILFDDAFAANHNMSAQIPVYDEQKLKDSYGNEIIVKKGLLPEFVVGQTTFTELPAGFFEGAIGRQKVSVLGGNLLKRFNWIFDQSRAFVYLSPNKQANLAFTNN